MSKHARTAVIVLLLALVGIGVWFVASGRIAFDWTNLKLQMRGIRWLRVAAAVGLIWLSVAFRAPRWKVLLGKASTAGTARLLGPQFVGFAVVALFGRAADLARPYLTARRTNNPVATQLAVYVIERAFDLGAAVILFGLTLALVPATMPHYEQFKIAGRLALTGVAGLIIFLTLARFAGHALAGFARSIFRVISETFAESVAAKILEFREGLRTITSFAQFAAALVLSMAVWFCIAGSYFETSRAFAGSAQLANFTVPQTMLLMASSMAGSLIQLPIVGWFSQIGVLALAYSKFFNVPLEVASAAGAVLMGVTTLGIIPAGLIAARVEGVSLHDAASGGKALEAAQDATAT